MVLRNTNEFEKSVARYLHRSLNFPDRRFAPLGVSCVLSVDSAIVRLFTFYIRIRASGTFSQTSVCVDAFALAGVCDFECVCVQ